MKKHKAKKSLGQNFLKSQSVVREIIKAGELTKDDTVLEIGPGKGILTEKLLESAGKVVAVEKDDALFEFLQEKFESAGNTLTLIHEDILDFKPSQDLFARGYKIIANIPYNITGAILKNFLSGSVLQPGLMVLMVQKEVAHRIIARDGKESILSISVKVYGTPSLIIKVPARFFSPAPKVDSAVIKINSISKDFFKHNNLDEEKFWVLIHAGFAHKRKKLSGNLKKLGFECPLELKDKRAEDLSLENWIFVYKHCFSLEN